MRNAIWRCSVATHTSNLIFEAALCATVSGCTAHTSPTRARFGCHLTECICKYSRRAFRRDLICTVFPFQKTPRVAQPRRSIMSARKRFVKVSSRRGADHKRTGSESLPITHHASQSCAGLLSASIQVTLRIKSQFNHRVPMRLQPFPTTRSGFYLTR